jgi:hypothetical protein
VLQSSGYPHDRVIQPATVTRPHDTYKKDPVSVVVMDLIISIRSVTLSICKILISTTIYIWLVDDVTGRHKVLITLLNVAVMVAQDGACARCICTYPQ